MSYRNENGSTGALKNGAFVAFASQAEADASTKPTAKPTEQSDPTERTVAELKAALDKAEIKYDPAAKKAELLKLATDAGV